MGSPSFRITARIASSGGNLFFDSEKRVGGTERVQPSWFHGGIGREVRKRKRFYHAAKCNPTPENERRLVIQRRVVKKMVRQAKVSEEHRVALACHDNPKEFFGYVNKHKPRAPLGPVFSVDGHLLTNDGEMARNSILILAMFSLSRI